MKMIADLNYLVLDRKGGENELSINSLLNFLEWCEIHNINISRLNIYRVKFWLEVWERELVTDFRD
jgi:hypothetical protein